MARRRRWRLLSALRRCESGQEAVEFIITLPILLVIMFGILEFGNLFDITHAMSGLGREAANIAARGTALDTVLAVTMTNGGAIQLGGHGGAVVTEIQVQSGTPMIIGQVASTGYLGQSRLGLLGTQAMGLGSVPLLDGRSYYAVEVYYSYQPFTPLRNLVSSVVPDTLYDRTIF